MLQVESEYLNKQFSNETSKLEAQEMSGRT